MWRAIREENRTEADQIRTEQKRRGLRMSPAQYGAYMNAFPPKGAK